MTHPAPSGPVSPPNSRPARLLLIEPEDATPRLRDILHDVAGNGLRIVHEFATIPAATAALERAAADLVLADISPPGALEQLTALPGLRGDIPFLVIDREHREDLARHALQAGAQDYLVRDHLTAPRLGRAIRSSLDRARADRELRKESALLHALLDHVPDKIYFKDRHSRYLRASRSVGEWLKVDSPADLVGRTDFDFYLPEHAEATFSDEQRVMETGRPIVGKVNPRTLPDGRTEWSSTTKLPLRDRHGRIIGICGITRDVSDLKRLEHALDVERTLLRGVIDNLPDPIYVKDLEGRYLLDNDAHAHFLGVEKRDILGRTVFDFFDREFAEQAHAVDQMVLRDGQPWVNHEERTSSAGEATWLVTSKVPLRDERGVIQGLVCINRDITARKRAQNELIAANESLRQALDDLKQAHHELHSVQLQLIEAEKLKSLGRLAAGVAHEVKNPLAIISMGVEFLAAQSAKSAPDPTTAAVLRELADAVQRADHVIKGMLDFSAPRDLALEPNDLNAIIRSALTLVRGELRGDQHHVELDLPPLPAVQVDRGKVSQVFVNLFANALQAMPAGGTLSIRTRSEQITGVGANVGGATSEVFRVGDRVVIAEVADTGPGIPEDVLLRIFEPFFTTKPTGQGTGLGMSVVRSIMNLQRGTIRMGNRPTGGALATVTFKATP